MKAGQKIWLPLTVLRVEGERLDAQTVDGQLIQTNVSNIEDKAVKNPPNHKAITKPSENKEK